MDSHASSKTQGLPRAPRPIMTDWQPVSATIRRASDIEWTSPLPVTGMRTASTTSAMIVHGALPVNSCDRVRGMHGDRVDALGLRHLRDLDRVQVLVVPAAADLDRQGDPDGGPHGAEDPRGGRNVPHEGRALALAGDPRHRAAHVQVDDVGAQGLAARGGLARAAPGSFPRSCIASGRSAG